MAEFYKQQGDKLARVSSLWDALELELVPHQVISLVGGGGKTSTMYQLAKECRDMGKQVIVTTSTHIAYPEDYPVVILERADQLGELYGPKSIPDILVAAGAVEGENQKLAAMAMPEIRRLQEYCDVLLIEADGSKRMPLKLCGGHEPVICENTQIVIGCVGLSALGKNWEDTCFRWNTVDHSWLLEEEETRKHAIEPDKITELLLNERYGTRKYVGRRPYRIVLNQVDDGRKVRAAEEIISRVSSCDKEIVIAASCYIEKEVDR